MATASDRTRLGLSVVLFATVLGGCNALAPVRVETVQAALPRQDYDSAGKKIPYVAKPNPYLEQRDPLAVGARSEFVVADGMLRDNRLKEARRAFRKMTQTYPTLSGPWVKLGIIAERQERYDEAIAMYRKAIEANGDNVNAYNALALVQRRQGDLGAAQNTYRDVLEVWKDFPEAHLNLAILYDLYLNRPEQAQRHYEAYGFLTKGKNPNVRKWLAEVRQRTGIEQSFIDVPPTRVAIVPAGKPATGDAGKANAVQAKSTDQDW
jgi:tetratricopeptide (TPR) repeat protein